MSATDEARAEALKLANEAGYPIVETNYWFPQLVRLIALARQTAPSSNEGMRKLRDSLRCHFETVPCDGCDCPMGEAARAYDSALSTDASNRVEEMVPLAEYKKLQALVTSQGIRLMEKDDASPAPAAEPYGYVLTTAMASGYDFTHSKAEADKFMRKESAYRPSCTPVFAAAPAPAAEPVAYIGNVSLVQDCGRAATSLGHLVKATKNSVEKMILVDAMRQLIRAGELVKTYAAPSAQEAYDRKAAAYKWAYEYLQSRMESIGRVGWAHDCDDEIEARIAATPKEQP